MDENTNLVKPLGNHQQAAYPAIREVKYLPLANVFSRSLKHIHLMATQVINCLHDLHYSGGALCGGLSPQNIMVEMNGDTPSFVLIDFEPPTVLHEGQNSVDPDSPHRTDSFPFLAVELLQDMHNSQTYNTDTHNPIPHRLRYDFESLSLVSLYCALTMPPPENSAQAKKIAATVWEWESKPHNILAATKQELLTSMGKVKWLPLPPLADPLRYWFMSWQKVFFDVHSTRITYSNSVLLALAGTVIADFDWETVNGQISRDILVTELTQGWDAVKDRVL